ncbi:MAG: hypothetical protein EOO59_08620 [Hymenobacter sp.]|nr:MAG: hypothetical protein EOO59_08620 [Hymenobacter sp.]
MVSSRSIASSKSDTPGRASSGGLRDSEKRYWLHLVGLLVLGAGALFSQPAVFVAPFNPLALNAALMALAAVRLLLPDELLPSAARCLRQPPPTARAAPAARPQPAPAVPH